MTISFIAAALGALSMFGVPPLLGYLAKEAMFAGASLATPATIVAGAVLVVGNALLGGVALAILIRPFMGALKPTPLPPHEGPLALWIGPVLFGLAGLGVVFAVGAYGETIVGPIASAIAGGKVDPHLGYTVSLASLPFGLSVLTWGLGILAYWQLDRIRAGLIAVERYFTWTADRSFDWLMFGVIRFAGVLTRTLQHGRLELYLVAIFAAVALTLLAPAVMLHLGPAMPALAPLRPQEWGAIALAIAGLAAVVLAPTRLGANVALGVQGLALGLIFIFLGAPDLGFTQLVIEVLSVVILALVMTRLNLGVRDPRPLEDWLRDGSLALICGGALAVILLRVVESAFDDRLGRFFIENSVALAHGHNIVNVILVDFRGLDTLGEISVVLTAGIAALALLRRKEPEVPR
jgi:multicomponent Na+:H+ antiporter subunit A